VFWPDVFAKRKRTEYRIEVRNASEPTSWSGPRQRRECQQLGLESLDALALDSTQLGSQSVNLAQFSAFPPQVCQWWSQFKLLAIIFEFVHYACLELIQTLYHFVLLPLFILPCYFFLNGRSLNILHAHRAYD